ncbi:MAG TPA: ribonuclease P protein component [Candidatus Saccharimonadales bacterium]|nr:ribonuclease P protein component [Candidatus Saccharimonadales bacterium]
MIGRAHRFHGYNSLRQVYRGGRMARGPLFGIKVLANPRRGSYRAAVVVSRKVSKSAVARNRMRRRLYAVLQELAGQLSGPYDIVITVFNDGVLEAPAAELAGQLKKQLKELGLIK